mgnify:CR=1 FL=1
MSKNCRVLIIDDSKLIRELLRQILSSDPAIDVVGTAEDPYDAREKIKNLKPDVLTLDIEMPKMDGITFLGNLMRLRPMPVVMISTLTQKGADVTLHALELGAVDYFAKPTNHVSDMMKSYGSVINNKIKAAAQANVTALTNHPSPLQSEPREYTMMQLAKSPVKMITIGASTGGTEAIKDVLLGLPALMPPIVIAQHIPPVFSASYAARLDQTVDLSVKEVTKTGEPLQNGRVYIAPGDRHLMVKPKDKGWTTLLNNGEEVNRHKPSVDVLFESVSKHVGKKAVGVMLTGMGADGAVHMKTLNDNGAYTIAQDQQSSVVWGMPGAAHELGGVDELISLSKIPQRLLQLVYGN